MKRFFYMAVMFGLCAVLCGCKAVTPQRVQSVDTAMGTVIQQNIFQVSGDTDHAGEIMDLIRSLEEDLLSRRLATSEVYAVNRSAGSPEGQNISEELAGMLEQCLEITERSEGAFDVTLGPVIRLWDIDGWAAGLEEGEFQIPSEDELARALALCGSRKVRLEQGENGSKLYLEEGMELDLGAVGKGLALTEILAYLKEHNMISGAVISVGGSVLTYGDKPDGTGWRVGVADPRAPATNLGVIVLEGQWCVSTSGDYERYVEAGGIRYHHILDPADGYPADSGLCSVTVVTKDGLLSDALSTACFVLGREKGMELAELYGAEALFVTDDGSISMTPGMEGMFQAAQ